MQRTEKLSERAEQGISEGPYSSESGAEASNMQSEVLIHSEANSEPVDDSSGVSSVAL